MSQKIEQLLGECTQQLIHQQQRSVDNKQFISNVQYNYVEKDDMVVGGEPVKKQNRFWFDQLDIIVTTKCELFEKQYVTSCNVSTLSMLSKQDGVDLINSFVNHGIAHNVANIRLAMIRSK